MRIKRLVISPTVFFRIMQTETAWEVFKGIPEGARLAGFTLDPYTQNLNLFVEHDSFPQIEEGTVAPVLETEFRRL